METAAVQTLTSSVWPIDEQISKAIDNNPNSIALSFRGRHLSYEELDGVADRFAGYLVQLGVAPNDTVAICMERSFDWIVAALGIMRIGAAYVPLDAAWPDSRLRFAMKDSGANALVARETLLDRLQVKVHGIDPHRDAAAIAGASKIARRPIQLDSLAYVIYTSGSTGVPKGVEITHANLAHLIQWHRATFNVTPCDRASHLAGLGFDASVWEIWPHLSAGAVVCLADDTVRSSPNLIQNWMIRERVTIGYVPTVHAAAMMAMEWPATTSLRFLLTGGDTLHHTPAVQLPFYVVNNYGPTECTVVATSFVLHPGSHGAPPIGRPIAGATVYLLNEDGKQVPDGTTGEIYIGGCGVGRGYRNQPDSTELCFLPDPFAGVSSARMYRTGDRGVRRPDGEIEFRGRLDRQTKIRGQRVELDEIGSVLSQHPCIEFATAVITISPRGENQLAAYVLLKQNRHVPTKAELQQHLLCSLPRYMIPSIFVRMHALPLSPNGKLDLTNLAHLPDTYLLDGVAAKGFVTPIEEKLLNIIRALLENDEVGGEDNFFLAGGHSLLGVQLLLSLRNAFDVDLTLQQLLKAPTVTRLALLVETAIEERRLALIWTELLGRKHVGVDDSFFDIGGNELLVAALEQRIATEFGQHIPIDELILSPTIRQHARLTLRNTARGTLPVGATALPSFKMRSCIFWIDYLCVQDLAEAMGEDQPVFSVLLTAEDSASLGESPTLESIASCLLLKILNVQSTGPYTIGGFCLGGIIAYEISSQLRASGHEVELVVLLDAPNPSYTDSCDSLVRMARYACYVAKRALRLGARATFAYFSGRLFKRFAPKVRTKSVNSEMRLVRGIMAAAVPAYRPKKYDGRVLLLLASERPPHVNLLPGWKAVVPFNLHTQYIDAHHRDIQDGKNIRSVADAILSQLISARDEDSVTCNADISSLTSSGVNENSDQL